MHTAQGFSLWFQFWLSYIITTADGHVRVAWGHLLSWAGARQVVVVDAAGIVAGDGGEGVQRQVLVQQTAGQTDSNRQDDVISKEMEQHYDDIQEEFSKSEYSDLHLCKDN